MAKAVSKLCNLITTLIVIVIIGIVLLLVVPRVMGYDTYAVLSGSMEPHYHVGSVVFVDKSAKPEEIEVGTPITFQKTDSLVATHRVVEINAENREFVTKGDANDVIDAAPVSFDQMVGRAGISVPLIGYISIYIKTKKGMMAAAGVFIILIILYLIPEILEPDPKSESETEKSEQKGGKIHE